MSSSASNKTSSLPDPALQVIHRQPRQRFANAAVHAPLGKRLGQPLERLACSIDLVPILAGNRCLQAAAGLIEGAALLGRQKIAVLGKRAVERQKTAARLDARF